MAGVATYTIAGRQIGGHYLAMGWLATLVGGAFYATSGPKKQAAAATPDQCLQLRRGRLHQEVHRGVREEELNGE
ncbi:hypothetical protein PT974_12129 [Cladobotryum mycophilum]|uniref:Uncharacterized protein n=1 Tax=Cladobotryum mycophilum TaxID=491253 RepID=A0ABR0S751_9HYPO